MKRTIITIAGTLGSGKSSTARMVAQELGFAHFSSGDLFRHIAHERGLSIEAMNLTAEMQQDIDHSVDGLLQEMYQTRDKLVIDSRLAWHWMPESFKVFLTLDHDTAAERIFKQIQEKGRVSESATSIEEIHTNITLRFQSEQKRYRELYGIDVTKPINYDLVVNTKDYDMNEVVSCICDGYAHWYKSE